MLAQLDNAEIAIMSGHLVSMWKSIGIHVR